MVSLFILWCAVLSEVLAFFLARYAVALALGIRGRAARFGFDLDAWQSIPLVRRIAFAAAGPFSSYLVAAACFTLSLSIGGEIRYDESSLRVIPAPDGPAARSGVEEGDRVVSIDGAPVADWPSMRALVRAHHGEAVPVVVDRAGRRIELHPIVGPDARIGVGPLQERRSVGVGEAIAAGLGRPFGVLANTARALLKGHHEPGEMMGPVGLVREVEKTSHDPAPVPTALEIAGTLVSYFIGVPIFVTIVLFPRVRRRQEG